MFVRVLMAACHVFDEIAIWDFPWGIMTVWGNYWMSIVFDEESSNVPKNHHVNILLFKSLESILLYQVDMAFEEL